MTIGLPFIFLLVGAGIYVGWNIGANDTANCIGTVLGAGLISFKRAAILVSIFVFLGAVLQGHHVMETIGKGIVTEDLGVVAVLVALICTGFFVTLATFFKIPTSTSQAIVGGIGGVGLAVGAKVDFAKLIMIAESWVICPIFVMALAFALSHLLSFFIRKITTNRLRVQNILGKLAILSACYVAYSIGANNVGDAVGPIANLGIINSMLLLCIGGVAIGVGAITYGQKVADTVGKGITPLDVQGAFVAQVSAAFGINLFSILGIPISTSSAIVGAVMGVGLVKGAKAINKKTIVTVLVGWVLTPSLTASASFLIFKVVTKAF